MTDSLTRHQIARQAKLQSLIEKKKEFDILFSELNPLEVSSEVVEYYIQQKNIMEEELRNVNELLEEFNNSRNPASVIRLISAHAAEKRITHN